MKFCKATIYKLLLYFCFVLLFVHHSYGQQDFDQLNKMSFSDLIKAGDKYFLNHDYNHALEYYIQAWSLDSNHLTANIAVAEVLISIKDYNVAYNWTERAIHKFPNAPQLQLIYCSILQEKGLIEESLNRLLSLQNNKNFKNDHKFWFYLGIAYFRTKNLTQARMALEKSIRMNSNFAEAHYLLGKVMIDLDLTTQGLLSYYYFLLLEPTSNQAPEVFLTIKQYLQNFNVGNFKWLKDSTYSSLDLQFENKVQHLLMLQIKNFDTKSGNNLEVFNQETDNFFSVVNTVFKDKNTDLESTNFIIKYIPYFYKIKISNNITTFSYYIGQSTNKTYIEWLETHTKEYENFTKVIQRG